MMIAWVGSRSLPSATTDAHFSKQATMMRLLPGSATRLLLGILGRTEMAARVVSAISTASFIIG